MPEEILGEEDTFTKRDDTYTKRYKELMKNADAAVRKSESRKPPLTTRDINFLLEIKDYDKFKALITSPIVISKGGVNMESNIFFYTNADATKKLVKKLNDRTVLKKLLAQRTGYDDRTVFFNIAQNDDAKKAKALQEGLSAKEFKRFMSTRDYLYETPYSIAQEKGGALKALLDPIFADET